VYVNINKVEIDVKEKREEFKGSIEMGRKGKYVFNYGYSDM
jgi:hypothetical protein